MNLADAIAQLQDLAHDSAAIKATASVSEVLEFALRMLRQVDGGDGSSRDRMLTAQDVADRLNISRRAVYEHAEKWPFTVSIGRAKRFSEKGLEKWIHRQ